MPVLNCSCTLFDLIDKDTQIIFDECKLISDMLGGVFKEHNERVNELTKGGAALEGSLSEWISPELS